MNRFEDAILKKLMQHIRTKNSWGKNELLQLIGDLAVDQISQIKPVRKTPIIAAVQSAQSIQLDPDGLPPF